MFLPNPAAHDPNMLGVAIDLMRWIGLILSCYNVTWTFSGFVSVARRNVNVHSVYLSTIFLSACGTLSFQVGYIIEGIPDTEHPRILMSVVLVAVSMLAAAISRVFIDRYADLLVGIHKHAALFRSLLAVSRETASTEIVIDKRAEVGDDGTVS